jgi:hypothetical protein
MSTYHIIFWVLLIIALLVSTQFAKKREKKLAVNKAKFCSKFSFLEKGHVYSEMHKHGFSLIDRASGYYGDYETSSILSKVKDREEFCFFDFEYIPKHADKSNTNKFSTIRAVLIRFRDRELYNFELRPENVIEKIKQVFGSSDINFEGHPEFSKKYVLTGTDPALIKARFPTVLIRRLESKSGFCIEARKTCLLIYNPEESEFEDYENLYKEALFINDCLR